MAGAIFIKGLRAALLDVLHPMAGAFYPVADHCATDQTHHGGQCLPLVTLPQLQPTSGCQIPLLYCRFAIPQRAA